MANKEIQAWALEVVTPTATESIKTIKEIEKLNGFIGVHITPAGNILALFHTQIDRNKAYTEINNGSNHEKDIKVALILPPAYIPADSIGGINGRQ